MDMRCAGMLMVVNLDRFVLSLLSGSAGLTFAVLRFLRSKALSAMLLAFDNRLNS